MKNRHIAIALLSLGGAMLLAACAMDGAKGGASGGGGAQALRVSGTVTWRERIAIAPDAQITVRLQDVSRMDAPAIILAEQRIVAGGRQPPFSFDLEVDPARIDQRMRYTVSARVERQGQLLFINDAAYPVLTQGAGDTAQLVLAMVRTAPR